MKYLLILILLPGCLVMASARQLRDNDTTVTVFRFHQASGNTNRQYTYNRQHGRITAFSCSWTSGTAARTEQTTQSFRLELGQLAEARESIISVYNHKDTSFWSCDYYFKDGHLADLSSTGHGKSEDDNWEPEQEVLSNYKKIFRQITLHEATLSATAKTDTTSRYREFYPDGQLKGIRHEGVFNGCKMPVGTDTVFYRSGSILSTTFYDNRKSKTEEGCHAGWTIAVTRELYPGGQLKARSQTKYSYEGSPCNCGQWISYDRKGIAVQQRHYGDCYDQQPCAE